MGEKLGKLKKNWIFKKKNWNFGKYLDFGKNFGNLEKLSKFEKNLEIWGKIWRKIENMEKKIEIWEKMEI